MLYLITWLHNRPKAKYAWAHVHTNTDKQNQTVADQHKRQTSLSTVISQ
jgi:hypothetical protein